jgi:hypothetical protein
MKIQFLDDVIDITKLTLGKVLFVTSPRDRNDKSLYVPCHLKGFANTPDGIHMVVLDNFSIKTIDPIYLSLSC